MDFLYEEYYSRPHIIPRSCHPRDIANHLIDIARYKRREAELSPALLRMACDAYFLETVEPTVMMDEDTTGRYNTGSSLKEMREGAGPTGREQDRLEPGKYDA